MFYVLQWTSPVWYNTLGFRENKTGSGSPRYQMNHSIYCLTVLELDNSYLAYMTWPQLTYNAVPFKKYSQIIIFYVKLFSQNVRVHSGLWVSHWWRLCWWILSLYFLLQKKENCDNSGSGHHPTRWDWAKLCWNNQDKSLQENPTLHISRAIVNMVSSHRQSGRLIIKSHIYLH